MDRQEALDQLREGIAQLTTSEDWQRWLRAQRLFHRYSFGNVLLIAMQRPDATHVAGFHTWLRLGHHVRKGEKGLLILAPVVRRVRVEDEDGDLVGALGVMAVLIGGFVGVANFLASRRQSLDTLELTRRGQMAERFTKAIEQLGQSDDAQLAIRLGGIYALEQISRDSEELHWPVMEVLTSFLRLSSKASPVASTGDEPGNAAALSQNSDVLQLADQDPDPRRLAADLQAAATVVGRRDDERR